MFGKLGTMEIVLILGVILLIFGPTQLPKLTKMFGKSIKGFKDGLEEGTKDETKDNSDKE